MANRVKLLARTPTVTAVVSQLTHVRWNTGCCDLVLEFFVGALVCFCCRWVGRVWFRQNCMIKMYTHRRISKRFGMCSDITYSPINSVDFDCRYPVWVGYTSVAVGIVLLFHYYTEMVVRVCIILEYDCPLQFSCNSTLCSMFKFCFLAEQEKHYLRKRYSDPLEIAVWCSRIQTMSSVMQFMFTRKGFLVPERSD